MIFVGVDRNRRIPICRNIEIDFFEDLIMIEPILSLELGMMLVAPTHSSSAMPAPLSVNGRAFWEVREISLETPRATEISAVIFTEKEIRHRIHKSCRLAALFTLFLFVVHSRRSIRPISPET